MSTQETMKAAVSVRRQDRPDDEVAAIELKGVSKRFGRVEAVRDCSLTVGRGSFVSLLGPSGCGKTTLLRMIGGFERQDTGTIAIHGTVVNRLPPNKRNVNTVFQRYALFPHKNVSENIAFTLEIMGWPKARRQERVRQMLALVHLEEMEERRAAQLSGGQAQRVALARALAGEPEVLLLDEPLAALDLKLRKAMQLELRRIQEEVGTTFLYVTHDQEEALTMSDTIVLMDQGRIVQAGPPDEIYDRPQTVFASRFVGEVNLLRGRVVTKDPSGIEVAVGDLTVLAPPTSELAVGDSAALSIRPERLIIATDSNVFRPGLENRVEGVVRRRVFLGHLERFLVEVGPDLTITVEQGAYGSGGQAVGGRVEVRWPKEAVIVLREGQTQ